MEICPDADLGPPDAHPNCEKFTEHHWPDLARFPFISISISISISIPITIIIVCTITITIIIVCIIIKKTGLSVLNYILRKTF